MHLTMQYNARIKAAKHKLESAEFNYKLFESKYTQFTPLNMSSEIKDEGDSGEEREYESETLVGVQKEYFGGSSISAYLGNKNVWGEDVAEENTQFFKTEVEFPLFSSNRRLTRIIQRTFEENELYAAQLAYVNTIRATIKNALEAYYDYLPRAQVLRNLRTYQEELVKLKDCGGLAGRTIDQQQLEDEINSLTLEIQEWEITVESLLVNMERWLGVGCVENYTIEPIKLDFDKEDYFGKFYVTASYDEILGQSIENDTELKVLELIKENAAEKKRLAQKGKWDTSLTMEGQYNFREQEKGNHMDPYYEAMVGIGIKRFDRSVLKYTISKAEADILNIELTVEDRLIEMGADITKIKSTLLTKKEQVLSSRKSLASRKNIHEIKLDRFLKGEETVDNYLQAFRSLVDTMQKSLKQENDFLDEIRDFDYICGVYFRILGIDAY